MSRVILFTSGKGGTGKSTLSAAVGYFLAQNGLKTLLVETDSGLRSLDIFLGLQDRIVFDISDILRSNCETIKAIYPCPYQDSLHMIAAPFDESFRIKRTDLISLTNVLKRFYDVIIVDSPAGMGDNLTSAICASDMAVIIATPEMASVRDAARISRMIDRYASLEKRLIINRVCRDNVNVMPFQDFDEIVDQISARLLGVVPLDSVLKACHERGCPPPPVSPAGKAASNIALRLTGQNDIPLSITKL